MSGISELVVVYPMLTPYSRVLPKKLTGTQLVKKLLASYGTLRIITMFTRT